TIEEICREIVFHLSRMEMMRMDGIITALGQNVLEQMRDEVRIPCEAIINYTKTIFSGAGAIRREDFEEMTQYIQSAELHVKNKTDKFLTLMDLIAAEISKELSSLAPTMKLNERLLVSVIDRQIAHKELQTTVNALIQPATLLIHEYYFSLLIRELIENAARFSKPDTIVHIIGGIHDNMYRLSVHDTGIGMSRNEIAHIGKVGEFNYTNLEGSENGLGLAIVMKILELCKGDIFIKSKKGFYTTVTLCLPLANPA
ncbi:MAG TPA: sensor histidine kinase, partial [Bacteroidota bacterium]|nr:sensor histidine kinase [Bacteroidota bacterium]